MEKGQEEKTKKKKVNTCENKTSLVPKKLSWPVKEPHLSGGRNSQITVHDSSYSVQCK